jgi:hypothetical protein
MSNRPNTELWASLLTWTAVVINLPHNDSEPVCGEAALWDRRSIFVVRQVARSKVGDEKRSPAHACPTLSQ